MYNKKSFSQFTTACAPFAIVTACGTTRSFDPSSYDNDNVSKIKLDITPELRFMGSGGPQAAAAVCGLVGAAIVSASNQSTHKGGRDLDSNK